MSTWLSPGNAQRNPLRRRPPGLGFFHTRCNLGLPLQATLGRPFRGYGMPNTKFYATSKCSLRACVQRPPPDFQTRPHTLTPSHFLTGNRPGSQAKLATSLAAETALLRPLFRLNPRKQRLTLRPRFTLHGQRFADIPSTGPCSRSQQDFVSISQPVIESTFRTGQPVPARLILTDIPGENPSISRIPRLRSGIPSAPTQHCGLSEKIGMEFAILRGSFIAGQARAGTRCVPRPSLILEGADRLYSTSIQSISTTQSRRVLRC